MMAGNSQVEQLAHLFLAGHNAQVLGACAVSPGDLGQSLARAPLIELPGVREFTVEE
jgi:hypothetical protein